MSRRGGDECRIYIGNMPPDIRVQDVEDILYKFGKITHVDLKNSKKGAAYAFVQFEDPRDASDAVRDKDGYYYDGYSLRVEFPRGDGRSGGSTRGRGRGGRGGPPSRRSENRVLVTDLPPSGSWQDLKDHMREAGDVCYADVYNNGSGVVEYVKRDDMKYAIRKLNGSKFKSHENETSYIRLKEDSHESRSRSRSFSPRRRSRRSPSYSSMS